MTEGLVISLASRGRPDLLLKTLEETLPNIADPATRLMIFTDEDDPLTREALEKAAFPSSTGHLICVNRARPLTVAEKWNWALEEEGVAYLIMVDHSSHKTPGFDKIVLDAAAKFKGGPGAVLGPHANMSFHCANACTKEWARRVGYIYPPYFPYWFTDHWFEDVAKMTGLTELVGLAVDSTRKPFTRELREPAWWATFFDVARTMREDDAKKVLGREYDAEAFRRRTELLHHRSVMVNNGVRSGSAQLSAHAKLSLVDERYLRAKSAALGMLPDLLAKLHPEEARYASTTLYPQRIPAIPRAFMEMRP
jgi:hypothetical protein